MAIKCKENHGRIKVPVAASTTIEAGDFVCFDGSTGGAVPGADTAGLLFAGIALHGVVNSGALGAKEVEIVVEGLFLLTGAGLAITDNGATMEITDAQEFQNTSTNHVILGKLVKYVSATSGWVEIGRI